MKVKLGTIPLIYPIPIALAGAQVNGRPNYATIGDCGVMGINPPLVYISLHETHHTTKGVIERQAFSINLPSTDMLAVADYCGIVSGQDVDKSALFESFYGDLGTVPMIEACPVNLECEVVHEFQIEHRHVFVGKVVQAHIDEAFVVEPEGHKRVADMTRLDPIIYGLDNRYYRIGEQIGVGYREGKALQKGKAG
ncbi:MAG: flavin reductase family protein [Anaerolineae bacterium]|nr:flavin reductase family protein [Anaerolineae bacterium]